jgi:tetratricopeptide (TPR) repeat protein
MRRDDTVSYPLTLAIVLALVLVLGLSAVIFLRTRAAIEPHSPVELEVSSWESAVEANPKDSGSRIRLGFAYYRLAQEQRGDASLHTKTLEKSLTAYDKSLELNSKSITAKYNRAIVLEELGRLDEALEAYEELVELEKGRTLAAQRAGNLRLARGETDKAITLLKQAVDAEIGSVDIRIDLARAYLAAGDSKRAAKQLEESLKRVPDNQVARSLLESITGSR